MRPTPDSDPPPGRQRARRSLTALLILLLVLLPLYLWPLRGATTGPRRAAALPGPLLDPRSAGDVARIPGEVWDALMGRSAAPPPASSPKPSPHNLTMIAELEDGAGGTVIDIASGQRAAQMVSSLDDGSLLLEGSASGDGSSPSPAHALTTSGPSDQGTGNGSDGFASNGCPGFSNAGPWGGGIGSPSREVPFVDPSDPGSLAPTPEPTTMVLVGSNLAWLGVIAWKRRQGRRSIDLSG